MAQVVATRLVVHGELLLRPNSGFEAKVLVQVDKKMSRSNTGAVNVSAAPITAARSTPQAVTVTPEDVSKPDELNQYLQGIPQLGETSVGVWSKPTVRRKTKIVCTIGPSTNTRE